LRRQEVAGLRRMIVGRDRNVDVGRVRALIEVERGKDETAIVGVVVKARVGITVVWLASARTGAKSEANAPSNSAPPDLLKNSRLVFTASPTEAGPTAICVSGGVAPCVRSKASPENPPLVTTDVTVRFSRHSSWSRVLRTRLGRTWRRGLFRECLGRPKNVDHCIWRMSRFPLWRRKVTPRPRTGKDRGQAKRGNGRLERIGPRLNPRKCAAGARGQTFRPQLLGFYVTIEFMSKSPRPLTAAPARAPAFGRDRKRRRGGRLPRRLHRRCTSG
jgi:hypothetical protein